MAHIRGAHAIYDVPHMPFFPRHAFMSIYHLYILQNGLARWFIYLFIFGWPRVDHLSDNQWCCIGSDTSWSFAISR